MDGLPTGWVKQWSQRYSRYFFVDTNTMESYWHPPPGMINAGSHDYVDPGLLGHVTPQADAGPSRRPYVLQGSLWSSSDPSSALLTPWQKRESPTSSMSDLTRRSLSSDGVSTPSDLISDDFNYGYRGETANAFAGDANMIAPPNALSLASGRSHSPMLGYDPTPTASHFSLGQPSPYMSQASDLSDQFGSSMGSQSLFSTSQGNGLAPAHATDYGMSGPYGQSFELQQPSPSDPYSYHGYDMDGLDAFHY